MEVHGYMKLHITSERFIIEPVTGSSTPEDASLLIIDRLTHDVFLEGNSKQVPASAISKVIYGIVGIIRLIAGPYLMVITEREKLGTIQDQIIWRVKKTETLAYNRTLTHLTEKQITLNRTYLSLVDMMLKTENYYFSTSFDLTHTLQRLHNTSPDFMSLSLYERADPRFVWNSHVLRELTQQPELAKFCLPLVLGFISISKAEINGRAFQYILISRRCIYRAGTRFNVRGVDMQGQVANFVETEQIVQYDGNVCSFVQTRGSIPLFWSQKADLRRLPNPIVMGTDHLPAFQKHFDHQIYTYGSQVIVNLINQHGREEPLEKKLSQVCTAAQSSSLRYEPFDFHKECSKNRWDRLSILMDRLERDRKNFG